MKRILFLFLDGVGLGPATSANPFADHEGPGLLSLTDGQRWTAELQPSVKPNHLVGTLDATLGVDGLPQSGTGQASLFTGVNCARRVGRHFGPYPHSKTHELLDHNNLFHQVQQRTNANEPTAFANAFPPQYFAATGRRATVTTRCCTAAGVPVRDIEALRANRALAADLTGISWREKLNLDIPVHELAEAATVLLSISEKHLLTLFEYFLPDKVGHSRIDLSPSTLLTDLDQFLYALYESLTPARDTLLITSDHGNLENTSHTQHTLNRVPLIVYGWAAPYFRQLEDLSDVTPAVVESLRSENGSGT